MMSSLERILPFLRPIQDLLVDDTITEVMVNAGGRAIFVERAGQLEARPDRTIDARHLLVAIKNIARTCGDEISDEQPILDARLADGSRVAAMFPPCSVDGAALTIRRFTRRYSLDELRHAGSLSSAACEILRTVVARQDNIVISGGTGSGKTTCLNALAACIPPADRIILIEDTSEIHIAAPNCLRFEARRARPSSGAEPATPAVPIAQLLLAALRHRPTRIIVGEVRGAEAFDLLQALNTGHRGSLTTIHANSAAQALARLAHCVLTAGTGLSLPAIREAIALAVHVVVHLDRIDGQRRVTEILRLQQYNARADCFELAPLFRWPEASG